jgi:hypothetical protein
MKHEAGHEGWLHHMDAPWLRREGCTNEHTHTHTHIHIHTPVAGRPEASKEGNASKLAAACIGTSACFDDAKSAPALLMPRTSPSPHSPSASGTRSLWLAAAAAPLICRALRTASVGWLDAPYVTTRLLRAAGIPKCIACINRASVEMQTCVSEGDHASGHGNMSPSVCIRTNASLMETSAHLTRWSFALSL